MLTKINYRELTQSRLLEQYKESENLIGKINTSADQIQYIEDNAVQLVDTFDISLAKQHQLDIIGGLVGQSRTLIDIDLFPYFGFVGQAGNTRPFGDVNDPLVGGVFRAPGQSLGGSVSLADGDYRRFIGARIIRNNNQGGLDDVIQIIKLVTNEPHSMVTIVDGNKTCEITINTPLSDRQKAFILRTGIVPKPPGVSFEYSDTNGPF